MQTVYQAIVNHAEPTVFAYEALSRPVFQGKFVAPDAWFQSAFAQGLSMAADLLSITSAVSKFVQAPGNMSCAPLFVNVMPASLMNPAFLNELNALLQKYPSLKPEQLVLEVIEYIPYNPSDLAKHIGTLRSCGIKIALDDMGVGYSTLQALEELDPDYVKLDRSLLQGAASSHTKQQFLLKVINRVKRPESIIAEGVEEMEDLRFVQDVGIQLSQGYYWSKPMSAGESLYLLAKIEIERNLLHETIRNRDGVLTDCKVIQKSQELDHLIACYHQLQPTEWP